MDDNFENQPLPADTVEFVRDSVKQTGTTIRNVFLPKMGTGENGQSVKIGRGEYIGTEIRLEKGHYIFEHADNLTRI